MLDFDAILVLVYGFFFFARVSVGSRLTTIVVNTLTPIQKRCSVCVLFASFYALLRVAIIYCATVLILSPCFAYLFDATCCFRFLLDTFLYSILVHSSYIISITSFFLLHLTLAIVVSVQTKIVYSIYLILNAVA